MSRSDRSGTYKAIPKPGPWLRLVDVQYEIAAANAAARPQPRKCVVKPGVNGSLIGRRFGDWWVRAQLTGGKLEVVCMSCMRTYERDEGSIVRRESTRCGRCASQQRKAG